MKNKYILESLEKIKVYNDLIKDLEKNRFPLGINGLIDENLSHIIYGIYENTGRQMLVLTYEEEKARSIYEELNSLLESRVEFLLEKEIIFYDIEASSKESKINRLNIINRLLNEEDIIVVASIDIIFDKLIHRDIYKKHIKKYSSEDRLDIKELSSLLVDIGYQRVHTVESLGQFSIRGGIIDIYSPGNNMPYRLELFGDEIDTIREFDVSSQRSENIVDELTIYPVEEVILDEASRLDIIKKIKEDLKLYEDTEENEAIRSKFLRYIDSLQAGKTTKNKDIILSYLDDDKTSSILDYYLEDFLIFLDEPIRINESIEAGLDKFNFQVENLIASKEIMRSNINVCYDSFLYEEILREKNIIYSSKLMTSPKNIRPKELYNFLVKPTINYQNKLDLFIDDLKFYLDNNYEIMLFVEDLNHKSRIENLFRKHNIVTLSMEEEVKLESKNYIRLIEASLDKGYEYSKSKQVVFSERQIFPKKNKKKSRRKLKYGKDISNISDLEIGAYVVHEDHGIGRYEGIDQLNIQGVKKDYLTISYKDQDKLYIPVDQMNLIQKYVGSDSNKPKINKLSSGDWQRTKARAKKAVEDMAEELLELYAKREALKGHKFSKDTPWQEEFEEMFPYEETRGQVEAIREIKRDMERDKPMDRLLCGDVGYGKTEVALRAAFKAIMDGKQVAFLVPTTILAQQHYYTIKERFKSFPINIGLLSRFRTRKQQDLDIKRLKMGEIDIVVGTHRLLSKDIKFKDLGLLIVDEEQRFGVRDKEKLKELSINVDVLTLTATPIPRTLHMSLVGIRDMSVLEEPPAERFPIQTYVVEYNDQMIRDGILKEIARGGQVYFVYNRVSTIEEITRSLRKLVPEAEFSIAHGQMGERQLEEEMIRFSEGEVDVLVCTTIIETGLDIGNVNTIIVYDADKMGLSQLYQLRGRVGRTNRIAYGYFTYARNKVLSEVAEKRLRAMREFTEFGSGFKIAMRDLEIRGAGNLLGASQHGHIEAIGYDLYVKFLSETIKKLKGEEVKEKIETVIDLDIDGYIPDSFIKDTKQKIEIYKKISIIDNENYYMDIVDELIDRFGDIPSQVSNLIEISYIKHLASEMNIVDISQKNQTIVLELADSFNLDEEFINRLVEVYNQKIQIEIKKNIRLLYSWEEDMLLELRGLIEEISKIRRLDYEKK